jgi:hypothetical protein
MDHGEGVKFEVGVSAGMPSSVRPAGGRGWQAIGGVRLVRASTRVGLAWGGRPCDGCLARRDWLGGLRDGRGMWGAVWSGLDMWGSVHCGGGCGCKECGYMRWHGKLRGGQRWAIGIRCEEI